MIKQSLLATLLLVASFKLLAQDAASAATVKSPLTIVTWNAEHLAYPARKGCRSRRSSDVRKLKEYTESLNADIIAFQEVQSEEAIRQVLPNEEDWQVIMSDRPDGSSYQCYRQKNRSTPIKVAFAVKKDIEVLGVNNLSELALDDPGLRYGLVIKVNTVLGATDLLNVHLKSGCFVDDYIGMAKDSCDILEEQAPIIDKWIEQRAKTGQPFFVLGDFNHQLGEKNNVLRNQLMSDDAGKPLFATIITQGMKGCHPNYPKPIDHIIVGGDQRRHAKGSRKMHFYESRMLSDHCAISFTLQ